MSPVSQFEFERSRGVVWVCDLANSSAFLNDDSTVDALEEFLPRLYWTAVQAVESARGLFVKWTGDSFLAWFETPLERKLGDRVNSIFEAAWYLTFLVNVTQLGVSSHRKLRIRHGIAYEPDAQLLSVKHVDNHISLDLIGRAVVLAFRMSGMPCPFPGIVTQSKLAKAYSRVGGRTFFRKRTITPEERLKFFKGQRLGTDTIYVTADRVSRQKSLRSVVTMMRRAISAAQERGGSDARRRTFTDAFFDRMVHGPDWCREVLQAEVRFIDEELLGSLMKVLPILEERLEANASQNV